MIELIATPGYDSTPIDLSAWVERIQALGHAVTTTRESTGVSWIEVHSLRLRGYAVMQGRHVEAVNFELSAPDPTPARLAVESAASALGWELDEDGGLDEADDDD